MAAKRKMPKKATAKKKSVKNLSQTHGKEEKFEPVTLDQIWGDDGTSTYGTLNENAYTVQLDDDEYVRSSGSCVYGGYYPYRQ